METTLTTLTDMEKDAVVAGGVIGATFGIVAVCTLIFYIVSIIATWKIFKKANQPGWKCLIPIYNLYIMYKIVNMRGWFWGILLVYIILWITMYFDKTAYLLYENVNPATVNFSAHIPTVIALCVSAVVLLIGEIIYAWRTSKAFGHGVGYFIGLLFLQPIFWLILGFDKSKYSKKALKK